MREKKTWAVKIDERGRITLPKELMEVLRLRPGDIVAFVRRGDGPIYVGKARIEVEIPGLKEEER